MPHISKKYLQEKHFLNIHRELFELLTSFSNVKDARIALSELFTKTEKIMLAKRLGAIFMIAQKIPWHNIEETLKMSSSTVAKLANRHQFGNYDSLLKKMDTRKWALIEKQIARWFPPRVGKNRFKYFLK